MSGKGRDTGSRLRWMRIGGIFAALALVLVTTGCGDDPSEGSEPDQPDEVEVTPENEVEGAIVVYYGDDKQAGCGILSSAALEEIGGIEKCLDNAAEPVGTKVEVTDIEITDDTATATVIPKGGSAVPFELVNEDGQWLIESPLPLIF